jgi:hypothetical protein
MEFERDKFFFHYTTREAAFGHILPERRLKFSRYLDMRDPLENKMWAFTAGGWGDAEPEQQDAQASAFLEFHRVANLVKERAYLFSVTIDSPQDSEEEEPFCRGWARARMWEQYAEKHGGVCLVFRRSLLPAEIKHSIQPRDAEYLYASQEVVYDGGGPTPLLPLNQLGIEDLPGMVSSYVSQNLEPLFFQKVLDWQTEHEYRFVVTAPSDEPVVVQFARSLEAVIVGEQFPEWQQTSAIETCNKIPAKPLRLSWDLGRPRLSELKARP